MCVCLLHEQELKRQQLQGLSKERKMDDHEETSDSEEGEEEEEREGESEGDSDDEVLGSKTELEPTFDTVLDRFR